jgi:hypothetical protein
MSASFQPLRRMFASISQQYRANLLFSAGDAFYVSAKLQIFAIDRVFSTTLLKSCLRKSRSVAHP